MDAKDAHGVRAEPADKLDSFRDLAERYAHVIRAVAVRVGGQEGARIAEDVEQSVLTEVWRQVSREQTIHHPSSYIYRAAVRETARLVRRLRRAAEIDREGGGEVVARSEPTPEERLQAKELGDQIRSALDDLSEDRRRAVKAHLAGFKVAEIMSFHGWPYQKARNLISRGMGDLRTALRERGIDGSRF